MVTATLTHLVQLLHFVLYEIKINFRCSFAYIWAINWQSPKHVMQQCKQNRELQVPAILPNSVT
jgi:hypothetical protein